MRQLTSLVWQDPHVVMDILGVDPNLAPEPLSFVSLDEGAWLHNMGM